MTDIFLSYGHDDLATARRFAESFEREGFRVWWDVTMRSGEAFDTAIETALQNAKAVVVLWSKTSVQSRWVRAEATLADRSKTLIPVMIEPCVRPIMFELMHTMDLAHWRGAADDAAWLSLLAEMRRFVEETKSGIESSAAQTPAAERMPSIAVLPFANMSGDKEQEYFSDGLAEEIINALAQIEGLKVIARTSAFAFKGQNTDVRRIAQTLGVANILEGSVRRAGNRIRVTAQLITASDGSHLWSERYDRELADVFAVQDEISAAISAALKVRLSPQGATRLRHTPTLPAYEALLKARHFHWKVTAQSMNQAKLFYEEAIALDPQFALAHTLYADFLFGRTTVGLSHLREVEPTIRAAAHRALELDPSLADAHGPLCLLASAFGYDWSEAGRQFALAMPRGRGSPHVHMGCGWSYFLASGRRQEAVEQLKLALQEDPLHLTSRAVLGMALGAVGQYAEAEKLLQQSRDLDPDFMWIHYFLADLHAAREQFAEALPSAEKAFSLAPWYAPSAGIYAGLLVRTGEPDRGREMIEALGASKAYGAAKGMAIFHTICGDIDLAADCYEKAIEERDSFVVAFLQGAIGKPLRASTHWPRLAAMMNLPVAG
ncbi:MAG: TIR domain-containing protein [Steroidobacteraceae bacterium]